MKRLVNLAQRSLPLKQLLQQISTVALPHLCLHCQAPAPLNSNPALCEECQKIHWKKPRCHRCGHPCHPDELKRTRCYRCQNIQLAYTSIDSCGPYSGWLRQAILSYKYFQAPLAKRYLDHCFDHLSLSEQEESVCTYIPSHPKRLKERGCRHQHMAEIVKALPLAQNIPVLNLLEKKHYEKAQVELSGVARRNAVAGSLSYIGPKPAPKCIHLFDDVWTTGSTIREASHVLKEAGVDTIHVHVFAWTSKPEIQ